MITTLFISRLFIVLNLCCRSGGSRSPPLGFWRKTFFGMNLREMLSGIFSQMMDTCYGENGMKISCPYPEKNM